LLTVGGFFSFFLFFLGGKAALHGSAARYCAISCNVATINGIAAPGE